MSAMSSLRLPGAVLFACNLNKVRSPMAAALMRRRHGASVHVDSCGLKPADSVDSFAVAALDELGIDISGHVPKGFDALDDHSFDLVVSLTPEAQHRAVELARGRALEMEYWPILDPTLACGSREQQLEAYRRARDDLDRRLSERFGRTATFGG
jgi:protein-tyrosine-phosphatase